MSVEEKQIQQNIQMWSLLVSLLKKNRQFPDSGFSPRISGSSLHKTKATITFELNKLFCMGVAVGNLSMEKHIQQSIQMSVNFRFLCMGEPQPRVSIEERMAVFGGMRFNPKSGCRCSPPPPTLLASAVVIPWPVDLLAPSDLDAAVQELIDIGIQRRSGRLRPKGNFITASVPNAHAEKDRLLHPPLGLLPVALWHYRQVPHSGFSPGISGST